MINRIVAALLAWLVALSALGHEGHQPLPTKGVQIDLKAGRLTLSRAARDVLDVQTVAAERRDSTGRLRTYANLVAPWTKYSVVTSRLPGRVFALHVRPGDRVIAGQLLAEVDSLDLHTLRLDYQQAQNDIELSGKILASLEPAARSGAISGQKLIEAQQTHRQNLNTLQVLRAKAAALDVKEATLEADAALHPLRLPIRSASDGIVVHADLAVGKFIEPSEHLMDVVDLSTVWVKIGVLERDWRRVAVGQSVRLTLSGLPGQVFETKVDKLGLLLDSQTHQSIAWAELANSDAGSVLRPGMSGQAEVSWQGERPVLTVPSQAVLSDGAERYVLVEEAATKDGSEYQKVAVVAGRTSAGHAEILAGKLLPGDRVVTRGGHELSSLFFLGVLRIGTETARTIGLKVEPARDHVVDRILSFDGALDVPPQRRTAASSQLEGKLVSIHVDRGQSVEAGDVLAEIASIELQDIQLDFLRNHLDGLMWNDSLNRLRQVSDSVPRRMVLETEGRVRTIATKSANLRQQLLTLGLTARQIDEVVETERVVATLPLRAPIAGAIVDFDRTLGQVVKANEPLFEIHDMSQVWVQAFIGERDSALVHVGQSARVRLVAYPDLETAGTVTRIGPVVGAGSRTQAAWIEFQQPPAVPLQHNMAARVTLTTQRPAASLAIPLNAVVRDGLRSFVFVRKADGTFDRRRVTLGRADDRFVEVTGGLAQDEMIATSGVPHIQTAFAALR